MSEKKKHASPVLKIKDLFSFISKRLTSTQKAVETAEAESATATKHLKEVRSEAQSARKLLRWVIALFVIDLGVMTILALHDSSVQEEQNIQLQITLQHNGEALASMSEALNALQEQFAHLNARIDVYVPGYTKYLYYNPDTAKVEVYNIAQSRIGKVGYPDAVPVADLDSYLKYLRKKPSK